MLIIYNQIIVFAIRFVLCCSYRVFPAEACETVGGEACSADMYPEVKLQPEAKKDTPKAASSENTDREYLEYNDPKT
jgi:hypothetical protein